MAHLWHLQTHDHPVPEWVLAYLDRAAENFERHHSSPKDPYAAIAEALEMRTKGSSVFARMKREPLKYVNAILARVGQGDQPTYAIEALAKQMGVSTRTLWRAWGDFTDRVSGT